MFAGKLFVSDYSEFRGIFFETVGRDSGDRRTMYPNLDLRGWEKGGMSGRGVDISEAVAEGKA